MKLKTSVTLSEETVRVLDEIAGPGGNRSRVIEEAMSEFVRRRSQELRDARDLEIINRNAEQLNREVEDILAYQTEP